MLFPKPPKRRRSRSADAIEYEAVLERDRSCVAPRVDPSIDDCAGRLTREHVRPGGGAMGARRVTDRRWMVILCAHHHLDGWATAHKPELRVFLESIEGP